MKQLLSSISKFEECTTIVKTFIFAVNNELLF